MPPDRSLNTRRLLRSSGLAAIFSSGLAILLTIPELSLQDRWLHNLQHLLMIAGLSGVYFHQLPMIGRTGFLGFLLAVSGTGLFLSAGPILGISSLVFGGISSGLGFLLLAVGSLNAGVFPRWVPAFWIAGATVGVPATFLSSGDGYLLLVSALLFAVGFIGAGLQLFADKKRQNTG